MHWANLKRDKAHLRALGEVFSSEVENWIKVSACWTGPGLCWVGLADLGGP